MAAAQRHSSKGLARRAEILETAMRELADNGYGGTSLRSIGRAMGLEPAHILYYFHTREALLEAVIERWDAEALAAVGGDPSHPDQMLDLYARVIRRNRELPGVVHLYLAYAAEAAEPGHRSHDFFVARFARIVSLLAGAIRAEQADARIARDLDPEAEARALVALADGMQLQSLIDPRLDAARAVDAEVARLRGGAA